MASRSVFLLLSVEDTRIFSPSLLIPASAFVCIFLRASLCISSKLVNYGFGQLDSQRNWSISFFFLREDMVKDTLLSRWDVLLWIYNGFLAAVEDCVPDYDVGHGRRKCVHIWTLITGFLLFGVGSYVAYRVIRKTWAAVQSVPKLPAMLDGVCRAINTQTEMLREQNRKLDTIPEQNRCMAAVGLRG
ncbi:hypothetical protein AMECASPLE_039520 [Ameca splendens]|uniref:Uncharacterized protein n=1 Tax=Ameca splendens TaxID=208324 RepID=A0ABV0ZHQ5_9TELE